MRRLLVPFAAFALLASACQTSTGGGSIASVSRTTSGVDSATASPTTLPTSPTTLSTAAVDASGPLGNEPEVTDEIISPSSVTADSEDPRELIQSILDGGEPPSSSDLMEQAVLKNLLPEGVPYHYAAAVADGLVIREQISVRLPNEDSLEVLWSYRWEDTPACDICSANEIAWDNRWLVWSEAHPERGMIIYQASHPELPLITRIWFFSDPIKWPEAAPETNPILQTTVDEADTIAGAILTSLAAAIPTPEN